MAVLLLRLCGPMQSWGTQSRFTNRDTELEPSKSGVVGLLCAAMGIPRDKPITDLAELKMGVRVDREGKVERDYHTAQQVAKANGGIKDTELSERFYLADACFLVALEGKPGLLQKIDSCVNNPVWQLYLGRKSFVPGLPVPLLNGLKQGKDDLIAAMKTYPYLCRDLPWEEKHRPLRLEIEVDYGIGERVKHDQPISFENGNRQFTLRYVKTDYIERDKLPSASKEEERCISLV